MKKNCFWVVKEMFCICIIFFSLEIADNCSTELSTSGLDFVMELFYKYDQDEDDVLCPDELEVFYFVLF